MGTTSTHDSDMRTGRTIIPKPIWLDASLSVLVIAAACASEAEEPRTVAELP
jgi:hypothetical protein